MIFHDIFYTAQHNNKTRTMLTTPANMYILAIQLRLERLDWFNENCDFIMGQRVKKQA